MVAARLLLLVLCAFVAVPSSALAQQRGSISGRVLDPDGLALPGATVVVTNVGTGFTREAITAETGAYSVPNLEPGTYDRRGLDGRLRQRHPHRTWCSAPGSTITLELKLTVAGVQENLVVTGESPLVERTSNQIGGSLSRREIEEVPSNFRNFTGADPAHSRHDAQPGDVDLRGRPGGGQRVAVAAERLPDRRHVQQRRPPRRQPGHAGARRPRQHRGIPGAVQPVQRRVRRRRRRDHQHGDARRHQRLQRPRLHLLPRRDVQRPRTRSCPTVAPKPPERTLQAGFGLGGPIVRNRAHFYFTYERDNEDIAGQKRFPAAAAPLAVDMVGAFTVRANNYFARGDLQLNESNFINVRWLLETAPTARRGLQHQQRDPRRQGLGEPTTTRCGPAPTPACSPTGCRASSASAASASR